MAVNNVYYHGILTTQKEMEVNCMGGQLMELLLHRLWWQLRIYLTTNAGRSEAANFDKILGKLQCSSTNKLAVNLIHVASRKRAPYSVIKLLCSMCPNSVKYVDERNQTAVHVAVIHHCCPDVISLLRDMFDDALDMQDIDGKTPLHLVCENWCLSSRKHSLRMSHSKDYSEVGPINRRRLSRQLRSTEETSPIDITLEVIEDFCWGIPMATVLEDQFGLSALEYAICREADDAALILLQRATIRANQNLGQSAAVTP